MHYFVLVALLCITGFVTHVGAQCPTTVRFFNGSCNNLIYPSRGTPGFLGRTAEGYEFGDGVSSMVTDRANERNITRTIMAYPGGLQNVKGISIFATFFAQFVAHDLSLTDRPADNPTFIEVKPDDPVMFTPVPIGANPVGTPKKNIFPPLQTRINVRRSAGEIINDKFEVSNLVTSYLDANQIYGSNDFTNSKIRSFVDGKLISADYDIDISQQLGQPNGTTVVHVENLLPTVEVTGLPKDVANLADPNNTVFSAGDERSSENILINTIHVLFMREHNRLCDYYKTQNSSWTDEQIFEKARTYVIAEYQNIIYKELLPTVFGAKNVKNVIGHYDGYDSSVDVTTSNLFTTVAFRYGHTTVPEDMFFYDECGTVQTGIGLDGHLTQGGQVGGFIASTGFFLQAMNLMGLGRDPDNFIRLLLRTSDEEFDHLMVPNIQSISFPTQFATGLDIAAADLRRARLHGIPNYHTVRKVWFSANPSSNSIYDTPACQANDTTPSPDPLDCFKVLTSNCELANKLRDIHGKLNKMDPLLGMLLEEPMPYSALGPTMTRIILEQFKRARDGDRFWWENLPTNMLSAPEKAQIMNTKMSDIISRNSNVDYIPSNVFLTVQVNPTCEDDD